MLTPPIAPVPVGDTNPNHPPSRAFAGYGMHWLRLQQGYSHELALRALLTKMAVRMSGTARINHYVPSLDVNQTDLILTIQTASWTLPIYVSVKSSQKPGIALGLKDTPGTLRHWLSKNERHGLPCLIAFAWQGRFTFLTPADMRQACSVRQSLAISRVDDSDEEQLFHLLQAAAVAVNKASAEQIFL
jgi:hypothetical protein